MKLPMIIKAPLAASVLAIAGLALTVTDASAAPLACPASFTSDGTAKVHDGTGAKNTAASSCEYITPPDPSVVADEDAVNDAMFFGVGDWEVNPGNEKNDLPDGTQSGDWSLSMPDFATYDYMITFKDGQDTNLISFLLNEEFSEGGWDTPFANPPFDVNNPKDVSHFTIFRTTSIPTEPPGVPLPATLLLLGAGLVGLGWASRRRH